MKYLILLSALLICRNAPAQQAKAYNTVHYKAMVNGLRFMLDYADGYLASSQIALRQPHRKTQVFVPESGVPETNGDFTLQSDSGDKVKLMHVDEVAPVPETIQGTYEMKGRTLKLLFRKTK